MKKNDAISRSALLKYICEGCSLKGHKSAPICGSPCSDYKAILNAPSLDVVPVVHARWIYGITLRHEWRKCSECLVSQEIFGSFVYCPNCGAKMDGDEDAWL